MAEDVIDFRVASPTDPGEGIRAWYRIMALAVTQSVSVLGCMGVCRNEMACLFSAVQTQKLHCWSLPVVRSRSSP